MRLQLCCAAALAVASRVGAAPAPCPGGGDCVKPKYVANATRADAVKAAFRHGWDGYYKFAFPHDALLPVENGFSDYL